MIDTERAEWIQRSAEIIQLDTGLPIERCREIAARLDLAAWFRLFLKDNAAHRAIEDQPHRFRSTL